MGLDRKISTLAVEKRKATQRMMEDMEERLIPHIKESSWPDWVYPELARVGINGLQVGIEKGGVGFNILETGAIVYEINKIDGSVGMAFLIQNFLGIAVVNGLGDEAQKARLLPGLISLDKTISFGLTEPENGSDASNLQTTAKRV